MKPAKKSDLPGISWMEPMLPSDGSKASEDLAFDLIANANALAGQLHPIVTESVGDLVRSMNCYYSNLIEGHEPSANLLCIQEPNRYSEFLPVEIYPIWATLDGSSGRRKCLTVFTIDV